MKKLYLILLIFLTIIFMFPLVVTITNSLMTEKEISLNYTSYMSVFDIADGISDKFINIRVIPREITVQQYANVLIDQPSFLILLSNSIKITLPIVVGNLIISLMSAYAFTIWKWKYKEVIFAVYIIVMLMPLQAVLVPNYIIADRLNIIDNYLAIILPGIFAPFGTFLLRQSMKALPTAYFEAAKIDGANSWYVFAHIITPQMKSAMAALFMLVFIEYWNMVEQSIIFIKDYYKEPLSVYLSRIAEGKVGLIFAASCVFMFPPFWFLTLGEKQLKKGIEMSGVK